MDNLVAHFFDLAADLFAGVQAQLDRLTSAALQDAEDGGVRLQLDFVLGGQIGANCCQEKCKKKREAFHDQAVLLKYRAICQQIIM